MPHEKKKKLNYTIQDVIMLIWPFQMALTIGDALVIMINWF
jgi:hypothetical protein